MVESAAVAQTQIEHRPGYIGQPARGIAFRQSRWACMRRMKLSRRLMAGVRRGSLGVLRQGLAQLLGRVLEAGGQLAHDLH